MDRRRRMDADGGRVLHRERPMRKLAVVVVVQNMLVAACLVVTLYVYCDVQSRTQRAEHTEDNVHIQFYTTPVVSGNLTVQFNVKSSNRMSLADKKNDRIYVNCTGPYVLYMDVCYKSMDENEAQGFLQLQVRETPVSAFILNASREVCRGLHSTAYLKQKEEASLHLYSIDGFRFINVTVGLSYLLGNRCEF